MNAKDAMLAELKARDPSRSLGQKFYTDPDFYRLDLETIFYRDWLFAGHDCEIPRPAIISPCRSATIRSLSCAVPTGRYAPCTIPAGIAVRAYARPREAR